jgi:hypothetical protein
MIRQGWQCRFCRREGVVEFRLVDGSPMSWAMTEAQHAEMAPGCARDHGSRGIYVKAGTVI